MKSNSPFKTFYRQNRQYLTEAWTGRSDDPNDPLSLRLHQVIKGLNLNDPHQLQGLGKHDITILGFCCDIGIKSNMGRDGSAKAPAFIRKELANFPFHPEWPWQLYDAGDLVADDHDLSDIQKNLGEGVSLLLKQQLFPIILGGGHELAFGSFKGLFDSDPSKKIGIINFDAHFDLRPVYNNPNSGTMFSQIDSYCTEHRGEYRYFCLGIQRSANTVRLFERADSMNVSYRMAKDMTEKNRDEIACDIEKFILECDTIYLTICADVFSSAFAPGVSSPHPLGLHPEYILDLVKPIYRSGKLKLFDIAEVSPRFDADAQTAKLAALFVYSLLSELKLE